MLSWYEAASHNLFYEGYLKLTDSSRVFVDQAMAINLIPRPVMTLDIAWT